MAESQFFVGIHGVISNRGRIVVLRRAAAMSYKPGSWDLPGGHLAIGEDFEQCLLREAREETGLEIAIERLLGVNKTPAEPYLQVFYACRSLVYRPVTLRPDEHTESRWVTPEEMAAMELIPYLGTILRRGMLDYVAKGAA
jgi:8-oxo-dGTP diphosphatase